MTPQPLTLRTTLFDGLRLVHGFTTRIGGYSKSPFDSMNLSASTGDDPETVRRNLRLLAECCWPCREIATVTQVHGASVLVLDRTVSVETGFSCGEHDAIVTSRNDIIVGIRTADCVPILLFDPDTMAVGAVHAGWRGTSLKIAAAAVKAMHSSFGSDPGAIKVCIGPHIKSCCYRTGPELIGAFEKVFGIGRFILRRENGMAFADLADANIQTFLEAGVMPDNIGTIDLCTMCSSELFFSHRRDGSATGRQLVFIGRAD